MLLFAAALSFSFVISRNTSEHSTISIKSCKIDLHLEKCGLFFFFWQKKRLSIKNRLTWKTKRQPICQDYLISTRVEVYGDSTEPGVNTGDDGALHDWA